MTELRRAMRTASGKWLEQDGSLNWNESSVPTLVPTNCKDSYYMQELLCAERDTGTDCEWCIVELKIVKVL